MGGSTVDDLGNNKIDGLLKLLLSLSTTFPHCQLSVGLPVRGVKKIHYVGFPTRGLWGGQS